MIVENKDPPHEYRKKFTNREMAHFNRTPPIQERKKCFRVNAVAACTPKNKTIPHFLVSEVCICNGRSGDVLNHTTKFNH